MKVYRDVKLSGVISKNQIIKTLGGELEKNIIYKNHLIKLYRDYMDNIWANDIDLITLEPRTIIYSESL